MNHLKIVTLAGLAMIAAVMAPGVALAGAYSFATYDNPSDTTFNQLLGINNADTIAGYFGSGNPGHPNQGYTFQPPSTYTPENFPGSAQTQVIGINKQGSTVGFWANAAGANFGFFQRQQGPVVEDISVNDPLTPASASAVNQLLGVNDHNIAVGFYNDANGNSNSYTYSFFGNSFTPISYSGATSLTASGINNSGEIAGFYTSTLGTTLGFLDMNGTFTSVNAPGASSTSLFGLNNNGMAVGTATINGITDGIVYNELNQSFQIVNDPNGIGSTMINGINDAGSLVGFYVDGAGNTNGFLATAVPEPGSLAVLGTGLLALVMVRRRKSLGTHASIVEP